MKKFRKMLFFIIGFFITLIALIVYRYEKLLVQTRKEVHFDQVPGGVGVTKKYTATEIVALIRNSKEYLGDTITLFENGDMRSSNKKFQGTIQAVIGGKDNMDIVVNNMAVNKLPIQYNIYILAAGYYRSQFASEFAPAAR